jgi:excisionase family DNA binding protein
MTAASGRSPGEPRLAFGVQEVADALGVSRELVKHMIRTGQLPSVRPGRRRLASRNALGRFDRPRHRMRTDTNSKRRSEGTPAYARSA